MGKIINFFNFEYFKTLSDYERIEYIKNKNINGKYLDYTIDQLCSNKVHLGIINLINSNVNLTKKQMEKLVFCILNSENENYIQCLFESKTYDVITNTGVYYLLTKSLCFVKTPTIILNILRNRDITDDMFNILVANIYDTDNPNQIYHFIDVHKNILSKNNIKDALERLNELNAYEYLLNFSKSDIAKDYIDILLKSFLNSKNEEILYEFLLIHSDNLSENNINDIVNFYINTEDKNYDILIKIIRNISVLSDENEPRLFNIVFNLDNTSNLIKISKKDDEEYSYSISKTNKNKISGELLKQNSSIEDIYDFLSDNKDDIDKKQKKEMIKEIINSKNYKYIILTALFIDNSLIDKIFGGLKRLRLFIYQVSFTYIELGIIFNKINEISTDESSEKEISKLNKDVIDNILKYNDKK